MSALTATLQIFAVGLGAFAVFAFLSSYGRYRKMQLAAEANAGGRLTVSEAVLLILERMRRDRKNAGLGLLRLTLIPLAQADLKEYLQSQLRRGDLVYELDSGAYLILVRCPREALSRVRARVQALLQARGVEAGSLAICVPAFDLPALSAWIGAPIRPSAAWVLDPAEWPDEPETPPPGVSVDPLTGVLKADRVPRALRRRLAGLRRSGRGISLVQVDVDQLSAYNRAHGRETGDDILRQMGTLLMANCRETDLIGRLEEDAFVLAMEGEAEEILAALQRMSGEIKKTPLKRDEAEIRFSAAFGMASMPEDGRNPQVLMAAAELALHEAKRRGRGLCMRYEASMKSTVTATALPQGSSETF